MRPAPTHFHRRGMTLIEVILVLLFLTVSSALVIPSLMGVERSGDDTIAKLQLTTVLDYQLFQFTTKGAFVEATTENPTPAAEINGATGDTLTLTPRNVTPGVGEVSAAVSNDGTVIALATKPSETCWFVTRRTAPEGDQPSTIFAYSAAEQTTCTGQSALDVVAGLTSDAGFGTNPNSPAVVP